MKRRLRTKIMHESSLDALLSLEAFIEQHYDITMIEEPNNGVVMLKMRDSARLEKFYLGEVLITECKVMIESVIGIGMTKGQNDQRAKAMAAVDAVYNLKSELMNEISQ